MLDLTKAVKIYVDGKLLDNISIDGGGQAWCDKTATYEFTSDFKIKVTKNNVVEYYNLSYARNSNVPNYSGFITVKDSKGETYYATLVNIKPSYSSIIDKGNYFSNGYYRTTSQSGSSYSMSNIHYTRNITNKWYFKFNLQNKAGTYTINSDLLTEAVRRYDASIPAAKITVVSSSDNYCELADFEDTWLGLCTSWTTKVRIQLNKTTMDSYYGEFTTNTTSSVYKKWLCTLTHELCHTLGFPDQASHTPSLYDYSRDRTKALYVQANDLTWLEYAYSLYDVDPSVLEGADVSSDTVTTTRKLSRARTLAVQSSGDDEEAVMNFDYEYFDSTDDLEEKASNIVTATLEFKENSVLNIGSDLEIGYNIYSINVIDEEKGTLANKELKIVPSMDHIDTSKKYRLYLMQYEKTPCSLINMEIGIVEI